MKCPNCADATLVMSERQGIEIDYCPQCRGVWLDRGELDKIIERTATAPGASPPREEPRARQGYRERDHGHYQKKKRRGFLDDLFDF